MADPVLGLTLDQRVGQVDVDVVDHRLQDPVTHDPVGVAALDLAELLAQVLAELRDRVELRGGLGERVVGLRQPARLDLLHQHPERGRPGELLAESLRGQFLVELR